MAENAIYQWDVRIKDKDFRLYKDNLVLWPYFEFQGAVKNTAHLGVLKDICTWDKEPREGENYLVLNPYFVVKSYDENNQTKFDVKRSEATNKPFLGILPIIYSGNSRVIARILGQEPFKNMEKFSDLIADLQRPYGDNLLRLFSINSKDTLDFIICDIDLDSKKITI